MLLIPSNIYKRQFLYQFLSEISSKFILLKRFKRMRLLQYNQFYMGSSLFIFLSLVILGLCVDPPIWPDVWSQEFVVNYTFVGGVYTVGKHWYDYGNNSERVTFQNGQYESICSSIMPDVNTVCTQILTNGNLYVIFPENQRCCRCCNNISGCVVKNPQWLQPFTYVGEEILNGQTFYKWTYNIVDYYSREDQIRTPRRIHTQGTKNEDYIMNTYSQDLINQEIFKLPSYCDKDCPRSTICGQFQPGRSLKTQ